MNKTLEDYMRESETNDFLLCGPQSSKLGWIYRDFKPMPKEMWLKLLDIIGDSNIEVVSANIRQLPPAEWCRAQIWISPCGQNNWHKYLKENNNVQ